MGYTSLSTDQLDCLRLLTSGARPEDIASSLGFDPSYVEEQLNAACIRLGVQHPLDAAMIATELGLVPGRAPA